MNTYSPEIVKAYNKWMDNCVLQPEYETSKEYASWKRSDKRYGNIFESLCKEVGLNYIEVARDLAPTNLYIN